MRLQIHKEMILTRAKTVKIIAVDLDHTLLSSENTISDENIQALKRANESQIPLFVATGRMPPAIKKILNGYEDLFSYYISYNGALVTHPLKEEVYFEECISIDQLSELLSHFDLATYNAVLFSNNDVYTTTTIQDKVLEHYHKRTGASFTKINHLEELGNTSFHKVFIYPLDIAESYDPHIESPLEQETLLKTKSIISDDLKVMKTRLGYVECTSSKVSKWDSLLEVVHKIYGDQSVEVMAIGDGYNDIEMVQRANVGVAVGNAVDELKALADKVVASNDESGVAEAIDSFIS